jgi:hypothetical protein
MCFERCHKAMRLLFEARRELEWIANSSELEAKEHQPGDKVEFAGEDDEASAREEDDLDSLVELIEDGPTATTSTGG